MPFEVFKKKDQDKGASTGPRPSLEMNTPAALVRQTLPVVTLGTTTTISSVCSINAASETPEAAEIESIQSAPDSDLISSAPTLESQAQSASAPANARYHIPQGSSRATTPSPSIFDPLPPTDNSTLLLNGVLPEDFSGSKHTTIMDQTYMQIIRSAVPNPVDNWLELYQEFVGTIIILQDPLSCNALAALLGVDVNDINGALAHLHSLLAPSRDNGPFRIHHKSFPDFITNPDRCMIGPEFLIDEKTHHLRIAKHCLRIMGIKDHSLKQNICNLSPSNLYKEYKDISQLQDHIQECISQELMYACTHWASHLNIGGLDDEAEKLLESFASKQILAWLEVLSIIGRIDTAHNSLDMVREMMVSSVFITCNLSGWDIDEPSITRETPKAKPKKYLMMGADLSH
ncbi:hypothetical protein M422DRAFT_257571 [Sphaerobolus stellatus SS14]|uniref:Uncharacterized protein n=1 Tax=Sphaerobolus stellatus (strain SS14) TaxID=990650 RepID=A0A0C9VNB4_SPHS4|nr:hypothetical protein M422DRAFT_257571 [Sphaerobolus stellatus SS14]